MKEIDIPCYDLSIHYISYFGKRNRALYLAKFKIYIMYYFLDAKKSTYNY